MNEQLKASYEQILSNLGEDVNRPGLKDTPARAAKAMQYLCDGYNMTIEEIVNGALFPSDTDEMVIVNNIELYSLCEHHMLPFIGKAHVAYLPTGNVIGLSKIARIVDMFARRLQIQENITLEIAQAIQSVTNAAGASDDEPARVRIAVVSRYAASILFAALDTSEIELRFSVFLNSVWR